MARVAKFERGGWRSGNFATVPHILLPHLDWGVRTTLGRDVSVRISVHRSFGLPSLTDQIIL